MFAYVSILIKGCVLVPTREIEMEFVEKYYVHTLSDLLCEKVFTGLAETEHIINYHRCMLNKTFPFNVSCK